VLIGHSIAGEELSSVGSRYPDKVAGLIYLDAVNGYSFYSADEGDWVLDMLDLRNEIDALKSGATFDPKFGRDMLATTTLLQKDLQSVVKEGALIPPSPQRPPNPISIAIRFGQQKYTAIPVPILAIFACPHNFDRMFKNDPVGEAAMVANDKAACSKRASTFAADVHTARVVQLPNASHYVFESNDADVTRETNAFLAGLP
jgi:pimeloyl-ACP methyl ester carboxylesterase